MYFRVGLSTEGMRFNDAKCSPDGTLFAGYMHTKWREGNRGRVYMINNILNCEQVLEAKQIHLPNGSAWSGPAKSTINELYLVDSGANVIYRFLSVEKDGKKSLIGRRPIFTLSPESVQAGHMLDGMTIDNEGMLWIAVSGGGMLIHVDPKKGEVLSRLKVPSLKPTSCTFGGPELDEIYITTRNEDVVRTT